MKNPIVFDISLLYSLNLFSQHSTLTLSKEFKVAKSAYKHQIVTHSVYFNNNFYTVTNSAASGGKWLFTKLYDVKFSVTVSQFDKDMNQVKEVVLENGEKNFGPLLPKMLSFNNKLYVAYFKAADKTSFSVYLAALDENTLTLVQPKLICTIKQDNVGLFDIESVVNSGLVYFVISPDDTKLLAVCKNAPNKVQTTLLDDKLQTLKQNLISIKTFDQVIIPRKIMLSKSQESGSGAIQIVSSPRQSDVTAGYIATQLGGYIVVIYNDNIKNLSKDVDEKTTITKSTGHLELAEALVNKERKLEYRKLISELKQGRATFYLGNSIPANSSSIIFPIGKAGLGFNAMKTYYTNWCFLDIK